MSWLIVAKQCLIIAASSNGLLPFGAKPLPEPTLFYCQLDSYEQSSVKYLSKHRFFFYKKKVENVVCKITAILFQPHCVKIIVCSSPYMTAKVISKFEKKK